MLRHGLQGQRILVPSRRVDRPDVERWERSDSYDSTFCRDWAGFQNRRVNGEIRPAREAAFLTSDMVG